MHATSNSNPAMTGPALDETLVLIPARMESSRLPGKPLADIGGLPMIVHVVRRAVEAGIGRVVVATDSADIARAVERHGGEAAMTGSHHRSGSDRIWEAAENIDPRATAKYIVNLQGDLPTIAPSSIADGLSPLFDGPADIATLAAIISDPREIDDPNVVKVVATEISPGRMRALYFTRATAPWGDGPLLHHVGLYAYRREALARFVSLPPSPLEKRERLEQLRALEAGMRIDIAIVDTIPNGVDTRADLEAARILLAAGSLRGST